MDITDNNFEQNVIEKSKEIPVLVDFWASWCAPCMMLKPILESLEKSYKGKFILAKVDVDQNPSASSKYNISAIPAVKLFKNKEIIKEFEGLMSEPALRQWIDAALK